MGMRNTTEQFISRNPFLVLLQLMIPVSVIIARGRCFAREFARGVPARPKRTNLIWQLRHRGDKELALRNFHLAMQLGQNPSLRHRWLFESIANLVKYSAEAIPPASRFCLRCWPVP